MVISTHCWYICSKISLERDSNANSWLLSNTVGAAEARQLGRSAFGCYPGLRSHTLMPRVSQWHMGWCPGLEGSTKPFGEVGWRGLSAQSPPRRVLASLAERGQAGAFGFNVVCVRGLSQC